jgi:membrane protein
MEYYIFIKGFFTELFDDRLEFYASSLSWNTIFSIIPILVILLSIFTYLPIFDSLYIQVHQLISDNLLPTDSKEIMKHIDMFVANAGKLGLVGGFYVIFATVMFFKNYDFIVNDIFDTPKRAPLHALKTYMKLITLVPLMIAITFYVSSMIETTTTINIYYLLPYFMIWGIFYISYQASANKTISQKSALISSFITSLVWYIAKSGFIFYVVHNQTYSSIYGGISILLFFFLWIYISWAIFLHGLRFCYILDRKGTL